VETGTRCGHEFCSGCSAVPMIMRSSVLLHCANELSGLDVDEDVAGYRRIHAAIGCVNKGHENVETLEWPHSQAP
jgi:hypothetical protein